MATTVRGDGCDACAGQVRRRLASHRRLLQPQVFVPASGSDSIASSSSLMLFSRSRSQIPSCRNLDPNPPVAHFPLPLERISEVPRTACLHGRDASSANGRHPDLQEYRIRRDSATHVLTVNYRFVSVAHFPTSCLFVKEY
ncbi:uncharacterized protein LOC117098301 isoform X1 [Trachypithecus francoisi]|uniref:uncharacterized protein LOC117098301 isoform X1 n=1 Tax=Trachypithecus francoisi TaxID=54180 RepID=UPI00141BEA27|nr:uncharacterized protein LOC117098301 isoform X1 [Trachypithecus francoisi]